MNLKIYLYRFYNSYNYSSNKKKIKNKYLTMKSLYSSQIQYKFTFKNSHF